LDGRTARAARLAGVVVAGAGAMFVPSTVLFVLPEEGAMENRNMPVRGIIVLALVVVGSLTAAACPAQQGAEGPAIAFYLVDLAGREDAAERYIARGLDQEDILERARPHAEPFLTDRDIERYCWSEQRIDLNPEGVRRWHALGGAHATTAGIPFLVVADGVPCYGAMVWNPVSSGSTRLPQFWSMALDGRLVTGCCMRPADEAPAEDVRFDARVEEALRRLGKLEEICEER
jgi:hypothetical protein